MHVPLTINDFLERAVTVYADRPGVIDEPDTPGWCGLLTYRELAARARGLALALDELGVGLGERVAIVSPNAARFQIAFSASRVRPDSRPGRLPTGPEEVSYVVEHSGASVLLVDPECDAPVTGVTAKRRSAWTGWRTTALRPGAVRRLPAGVGSR